MALVRRLTNVVRAIEYGEPVHREDLDALKALVANYGQAPPAIARVLALGEWTGDEPGWGHFMWSGPVDRKTGIPIMYRWDGKKDVPVYKILWSICRSDACFGRPHKLPTCDARLCASPLCYMLSIPMHIDGRVETTDHKRFRRLDGHARKPIWAGESEVREGNRVPVCPQCRQPLGWSLREAGEHMGKQIACRYCEAADDDIRTSMGYLHPEKKYRWGREPSIYARNALVSEAEAREIERANELADADAELADLEALADASMEDDEPDE